MNSATLRIACLGELGPALLACVELDRRAGVASHRHLGAVEIVDHVTVWVFEDGVVLGATSLRSVISHGQVIGSRPVRPPTQAALSATERLDVLHAAGLRELPAVEPSAISWEVA